MNGLAYKISNFSRGNTPDPIAACAGPQASSPNVEYKSAPSPTSRSPYNDGFLC